MRLATILTMALILILGVVACSDSESTSEGESNPASGARPTGPIEATWIEPEVNGDVVSIQMNAIEANRMIHFGLDEEDGHMDFMAYIYDGETFVRANVCPPCRSVGFSLNDDELVCDMCGTLFEANSGKGISGACKDYPKAAVAYEIIGDKLIMQIDDLSIAYDNTKEAGWP